MPLTFALVDGDLLVYRIGFTTEDVDVGIAKWRLSELLKTILEGVQATEFQVYLTASNDGTAFRKQAYSEYKANRKAPRPIHYEALRYHLVTEHGASVSTTIEADDAIGIDAGNTPDCVIVSIDKDLLQIPGRHYNFVKQQFTTVNNHSGIRFFYKQLLMGDKADNIKGVAGIGEVKAEKILNAAEDYCEAAWFDIVRATYNNDKEMWHNGECLLILQKPFPQGTWSYHPLGSQLLQEMEEKPLYLQRQSVGTSVCTTPEMSTDGQVQLGLNLEEHTNSLVEMQP